MAESRGSDTIIPERVEMKKGDKVRYVDKGFLGFVEEDRDAEFVKYEGKHDAYILYKGKNVLVYLHEIKAE